MIIIVGFLFCSGVFAISKMIKRIKSKHPTTVTTFPVTFPVNAQISTVSSRECALFIPTFRPSVSATLQLMPGSPLSIPKSSLPIPTFTAVVSVTSVELTSTQLISKSTLPRLTTRLLTPISVVLNQKLPILDPPFLISFEVLLTVVSVTIFITSSMVIHQIFETKKKCPRINSIFIILSVSDIAVGLLSLPVLGIFWYSQQKQPDIPFVISAFQIFFGNFPYSFSFLITMVIALDRLFVVTLQQKYKNIVTGKMLKLAVAVLFLLTLSYTSAASYYLLLIDKDNIALIDALSVGYNSACMIGEIIMICAYFYILIFASRKFNETHISKHCHIKKNGRRLTKTIMFIFISQSLCNLPYSTFWLIPMNLPMQLKASPWLSMMRSSQCFCNALIFLMNQKKRKTPKSFKT